MSVSQQDMLLNWVTQVSSLSSVTGRREKVHAKTAISQQCDNLTTRRYREGRNHSKLYSKISYNTFRWVLLAATWQDLHSTLEAPVVALLKKWSVQPGGRQLILQNWSSGRHTNSIFRADLAYGETVPSNYGCKKVTVRVSIFSHLGLREQVQIEF